MNNAWSIFEAKIKKAVGEKNYDEAIKAIRYSICPKLTAYVILTKGFRDKKNGKIIKYMCQNTIQSHMQIQICTSWAHRLDFFPKPPPGVSSEIYDINQFLNLRGNPYSYFDLFKLVHNENTFLHSDSILNYIWRIGWHRGINIQKVFAEASHPKSIGKITDVQNESYRLLTFPIGYPHQTGQTKSDSLLFNSDWICYFQKDEDETSKSFSIIQTTDEMEDIEDNNNQLDVEIIRNRNVHKLLLFGGPKALQASQIAATELDTIYGNKGDFILTMLEDDDVANELYPVLLKRLRNRAIKLYLRKISEPRKWSKKLESAIPDQRTIYKKERVFSWVRDEFSFLEARDINYSIEKVYLLEKFVEIVSPNNLNSIEFKSILINLRSFKSLEIKLTYFKALCLYSGALFLHELLTADIIDLINSSSVKAAVEIGITDIENHGYYNILKLIADSLKSQAKKNRYYPIELAIYKIAGLFFEIDIDKSVRIAAAGALFAKTITDVDKESTTEPPFINCQVGDGHISLSLTSGIPFEFDLTSYSVFKTKT